VVSTLHSPPNPYRTPLIIQSHSNKLPRLQQIKHIPTHPNLLLNIRRRLQKLDIIPNALLQIQNFPKLKGVNLLVPQAFFLQVSADEIVGYVCHSAVDVVHYHHVRYGCHCAEDHDVADGGLGAAACVTDYDVFWCLLGGEDIAGGRIGGRGVGRGGGVGEIEMTYLLERRARILRG
jgi:hypothetical protein